MPRKGKVPVRELEPDPIYGSKLVTKLINYVMWDGKKSIAEKIVYGALKMASERLKVDPMELLEKVMENVKPVVEVRPRRVGGATYQVPVEVTPRRAEILAVRWIVQFARKRGGMPMVERLARELMDAYKGEGNAVKKKEDTHRMAEANRAFSHYRW